MAYGKLRHYVACGEDGQALGEFSLVLAFVAMAAVAALTALGMAIGGFWDPLLNVMG